MTDKPTQCHPGHPPLQLPPNFRDVTAEKVGTIMAMRRASTRSFGAPLPLRDAECAPEALRGQEGAWTYACPVATRG
jgi:hypothetical protein